MRHVAMLIPTLDQLGGAERQVMLLAKGMVRRSWRVSVVTLAGTGGERAEELRQAGIEFVSLEMRKGVVDARGWMRLLRWQGKQQPDVVHAHLPHAVWMARWARVLMPVRVVVDTIHTSSTGKIGRKLGYRWSHWLTDQVTAVSEDVASAYRDAGMVGAHKLIVVPNGVEMRELKADVKVQKKIWSHLRLKDEFLWLTVGRLEPVKDHATLLRAFKLLPICAQLAIAGRGSLEAELKSLAGALGISERVHFLGFVQNTRDWMQAADGHVLTSRWEGLPMGVLEASACGLPTVATNVPGTREVVKHGQTGLLAKAGDAGSVASALLKVMGMSAAKRAALGDRARLEALERFDMHHVLGRWERLYEALLKGSPEPKRHGHRLRSGMVAGFEGEGNVE